MALVARVFMPPSASWTVSVDAIECWPVAPGTLGPQFDDFAVARPCTIPLPTPAVFPYSIRSGFVPVQGPMVRVVLTCTDVTSTTPEIISLAVGIVLSEN
jgi:hypothetical protein